MFILLIIYEWMNEWMNELNLWMIMNLNSEYMKLISYLVLLVSPVIWCMCNADLVLFSHTPWTLARKPNML